MVQYILVIVCVLFAAIYLGRKFYLNFSGKQTPGCEKCAANQVVKKGSV